MGAVEDYVHEFEEGEFDSHGAFTVDLARARLKLAKFQLRGAHEKVLKLIQGLVLLQGKRIWLDVGTNRLSILVEDPARRLDLGELREALESANLSSDSSPQKHLGIGLCAILAEGHPSAYWVELNSKAEAHVEKIHGDDPKALLKFPKAAKRNNAVCLHIQGVQLSGLFGSVDPEFAAELLKRCPFLPVPLLLNGSLIQKQTWAPSPAYWRGGDIYVDAYHLDPTQPEQILLCPPGPCDHQLSELPAFLSKSEFPANIESNPSHLRYMEIGSASLPALRFDTPTAGVLAGLFSSQFNFTSTRITSQFFLTDPTEPSWIWPVQAGVMLEPEPLKLPVPGVLVVIAAPHIHTDLSQFRVLPDEHWQALQDGLVEPLTRLLRAALQESQRVQPGQKYDGTWTWLGATGMICLPLLVGTLLNLPQGVVLGGWLAGLALPWYGYRKDQGIVIQRFTQESRHLWEEALGKLEQA